MTILNSTKGNRTQAPIQSKDPTPDSLSESFFPKKEFLEDLTPEDQQKVFEIAGSAHRQASLKPEAEKTFKGKNNTSITKSISKDIHEKASELGDKAWDLAASDDLNGADIDTKLRVALEAKELAMNYAVSEERYEYREKDTKKQEPQPDPRDKQGKSRRKNPKKR